MSIKISNLVSRLKFLNNNVFEIILKKNVIKIRNNVKNLKLISNPYFYEIEFNKKIKKCPICDRIQNNKCNLCKFNTVYFIKQFD
tara:strand:- start:2217 stop:2471 length:255 start_codon:yes stop_codon:yes gene_type:complete